MDEKTGARALSLLRNEISAFKKLSPLPVLKTMAQERERAHDFIQIFRDKNSLVLIKLVSAREQRAGLDPSVWVDPDGTALARAFALDASEGLFAIKAQLDLARSRAKLPLILSALIIDEWQIYAFRAWGADAVLIHPELNDAPRLQYFLETARECGLEPGVVAVNDESLSLALATDSRTIVVSDRLLANAEFAARRVLQEGNPRALIYAMEPSSQTRLTGLYHWGYRGIICGEQVKA